MSATENAPVTGQWVVTEIDFRDYENIDYQPVAVFSTEEEADACIEAFVAKRNEILTSLPYELNTPDTCGLGWNKKFVPSLTPEVSLVPLYTVNTYRNPEVNGKREIKSVRVNIINPAVFATDVLTQLIIHNPDKAFQVVSEDDEGLHIEESSVFSPLPYLEEYKAYNGEYETFSTLNLSSVVLTPPADYIHPEIPVKTFTYGIEPQYDELEKWEQEILDQIAAEKKG